MKQLLKHKVVDGKVIAVDGTAVKVYSQGDLENKRGKSDLEARVGRGRRGFVLGYKVHTVCCANYLVIQAVHIVGGPAGI